MLPFRHTLGAKDTGGTGHGDMEWDEALFIARGGELPLHPAAYYRRQAARARQIAVGVTTRAMKARLLADAARYDELAGKADRIGVGAMDF